MEQSPSWEANSQSASQEDIRLFMKTEISLRYLQEHATCSCSEQDNSSAQIPKLFL
jgi:hypothetical protein